MSMEINEARKKLDMLEQLAGHPELIFTNLYKKGVHDGRFLQEITMDSMDIGDYLASIIKKIDVFQDTRLNVKNSNVHVYIPRLKCEKLKQFQPDDQIATIDLQNHAYCLCNRYVNSYKEVLNETSEFTKVELAEFWKQFENLTFSKRARNAFNSLKAETKLRIKLANFVYSLVVSKSKIENALERERKRVDDLNQNRQECYNRSVELKAFYEKYAPEHIEIIKQKQQEIAGYLEELGYEEMEEP